MTQYTCDGKNEAERRAELKQDLRSYVWGYALAILLTLAPFGMVHWHVLQRGYLFLALGVFALAQMIVHFRFFLHIGLKRQREDLHLILFSALILAMMIAGTLWIMVNLYARMAPEML